MLFLQILKNLYVQLGLMLILGVIVGAGLVFRFRTPEVKIVERTVTKEVFAEKKKNVQTKKKVVTKPDGTRTEETVIVDNTSTSSETTHSDTDKVFVAKHDWNVGVFWIPIGFSRGFVFQPMAIGINVQRRILGDFYMGGFISTAASGLSVSYSF